MLTEGIVIGCEYAPDAAQRGMLAHQRQLGAFFRWPIRGFPILADHMRLLISLALLFARFALAQAPTSSADPIDDYVHSEMQRQRIPGLSLLVARDGKIVRAEGYGLANVELQVPVKPETVFQSGSVGKQFTATAVMMLVEEGKISLDDVVTKYLKGAPTTWNQVTIRALLSHTAGFTDYPKNFNFRRLWAS